MDHALLASASQDGSIKIWDSATGQCKWSLDEHNDAVNSANWSPDGVWLASASDDHTVKIWNPATGQCKSTLKGHSEAVYTSDWSPDSTKLMSVSKDGTVKVWDIDSGNCINLDGYGHEHEAIWVSWSPDGAQIASASSEGSVQIWDGTTYESRMTLKGHSDAVLVVVWSPDGKRVASASQDQSIKVWELETASCVGTFEGHSDQINWIAWSPDGSQLASASSDNTAKLWDTATSQVKFTFSDHSDCVNTITWSHNGTRLASVSDDSTIRIWDPVTGECTATLNGHSGPVNATAWSPSDTWLVSASDDFTMNIWDVSTWDVKITLKDHAGSILFVDLAKHWASPMSQSKLALGGRSVGDASMLAWSTDARWLASSSQWPDILLWDLCTGLCVRKLNDGEGVYMHSIAWSPDSTRLASGTGNGSVKIWDPALGECVSVLTGHTREVACVSWSPDGRQLASGSFDGTIKFWDPATGNCTQTLEGYPTANGGDISWSPNSCHVVLPDGFYATRVWDYRVGAIVKTLPAGGDGMTTWSPDAKFLVTSYGPITIWDTATWESVKQFEGRWCAAWFHDGRRLATCEYDSQLYIRIRETTTSCYKILTQIDIDESLGNIVSLGWSPCGTRLAACSMSKVHVWNAVSGSVISVFEPEQMPEVVMWQNRDNGYYLNLPPFPGWKLNAELDPYMKQVVTVQSRLYLLEASIRDAIQRSSTPLLDAIANALYRLDGLLELWRNYSGGDSANKERHDIIQAIQKCLDDAKNTVSNNELFDVRSKKLLELDNELALLKTQIMEDAAKEQRELEILKSELSVAVNEMYEAQNVYQKVEAQLREKQKEFGLENAVTRKPTIVRGTKDWYKGLLRRRVSLLQPLQRAADVACLVLETAELKVHDLQVRQQTISAVHKGRSFVQREIGETEAIAATLRIMCDGITQQDSRVAALIELMSAALVKLTPLGETPYQRHRRTEDEVCATILSLYRESLIDVAFVKAVRAAVDVVKEWFDDEMPDTAKAEIAAIEENPLYQETDDDVANSRSIRGSMQEQDEEQDDDDMGYGLFDV